MLKVQFDILYEDDYIIAVNKPPGLIIHRTRLSEDKVFLLQQLRNQLGAHIYTIHRLDRPTSGVILFAKSAEVASVMSKKFEDHKIEKSYLALVRGWMEEEGVIDYPLTDEETGKTKYQNAVTRYQCLDRSEISHAIGNRYKSARFSLVKVCPDTGRRHQIRKHLSHLRHPIIGDKKHGDVKQNKYFNAVFDVQSMCLHAHSLTFKHPIFNLETLIVAPFFDFFNKALLVTELKFNEL